MELIKFRGANMKRILYLMVMILMALPSYGADTNEICKRKTLMMIVLQKDVNTQNFFALNS